MNRSAAVYNKSGKSFYRAGKYQDAVDAFLTGIALDPDNGTLHYNLAAALFKNGDMIGAAVEAQKTLDLDPGYDKARTLLEGLASFINISEMGGQGQ